MKCLLSKTKRRYSTPAYRLAIGLGCLCLVTAALASVPQPVIPNRTFNVTNYGAVGDGVSTNTAAIQSAINAAGAAGGGTVEIPSAVGAYLCGPINLQSKVNLQIDAGAILRMLPYGKYPSSGANFITASYLNDVEISGSGAIDGQGQPWWSAMETNSALARPRMIEFNHCYRQMIRDVTLSNSPMFHMAFSNSKGNLTVDNVTVHAPASSHNTDACDVSGTNILVENCHISVGDDDFTCGGGTADVLLTNNVYGTGHGVSVGSYTDGGVSNITVVNCTFNGTDNGIRLKSERGRGGLVQNLHYLNLKMTNVAWPLLVYSYYEYGLGTLTKVNPEFAANAAASNPTSLTSTTPIYHNITFSNIVATAPAGRPPLMVWGLPEAMASNIVFDDVHITSSSTLAPGIYNATNIQFINCSFDYPSGVKTMQLWNANVIFTNTLLSTQLYQLDGLTTNGLGNSLEFYDAQGSLRNTNAFGSGPLTLSASTFTVNNNLTLFPDTVLNYVLGTNSATLIVEGNLKLGGKINLAAGSGVAAGTYTLMTYTGSLEGSLPALGTLPAGYTCQLDTNTTGQVNLVVTLVANHPPSTPSNLKATAGDNSVALSWSSDLTATGYELKRSIVSGGPYSVIATPLTASYTDTQAANGTTYYYVVAAVNGIGQSANSAQVSATPHKPTFVVVTTNAFADSFSSSSLNSSSPATPTASSTSYEMVSSKSWSSNTGLSQGNLQFGINATSSGCVEAQARFAKPVTLAVPGDRVSLILTFYNTAGLLTGSGALGFGLYNSGGASPVPGGLNGTATTSSSGSATGYAQSWQGYVGQVAYTGGDCRIMTRLPQTQGTLYNNDQDLVTSGSGSSSYNYPSASTVGSASSAPSVALTAGSIYTEVLTITLAATNTLAITNSLYSGANTNGVPLSQFGGVASGANYLTNTFDALAVGWRETGSQATAIDISHIAVQFTTIMANTNPVSMSAPNLAFDVVGDQLHLAWPAGYLGWTLETNAVGLAATNAWFKYSGSAAVTNLVIPVDATEGKMFYRLIQKP